MPKTGDKEAEAKAKAEAEKDFRDFVLKEYDYVTKSFSENEQLGETRVDLFIKITAAVLAFLTIVSGAGIPVLGVEADPRLFVVGCVALLLFGLLTLKRMVVRNNTTDGYKEKLMKMRKFLVLSTNPNHKVLPYDPYRSLDEKPRIRSGWKPLFSLRKGGMAETVMLLNSLIGAGIAVSVLGSIDLEQTVFAQILVSGLQTFGVGQGGSFQVILYGIVGIAFFVASYLGQSAYARSRYNADSQERKKENAE